MKHFLRSTLAGVVGLTLLCAATAPAQAALVLSDGPNQGSFTNNFGFGAGGTGTAVNPNARYWSGPSGSETYTSHLGNAPVAILFVFGANGQISTYRDTSAGSYDNVEDTQIGVLNMSGSTITSIHLTAKSGDPFGFDGDGISSPNGANSGGTATGAGAPSNAKDISSGIYGGPMTYFTLNAPGSTGNFSSSTSLSAYANFNGGLADGAFTYFSLEGTPSDLGNLGGDAGAAPEPATLAMAASGALMALGYGWLRRRSGLKK
jgi:hypothetical protein